MKKLLHYVLWLFLLPLASAQGQTLAFISQVEEEAFKKTNEASSTGTLSILLASSPQMSEEKITHLYEQLLQVSRHLQQQKQYFTSEKKYLQWVVEQIRSKYLHTYALYPTFDRLFIDGTFNCLSGSALYAILLQQLNYTTEIHETAFHAYLIVKSTKRTFLIDATDAENGFVGYAYQIQARQTLYRENERARHQPAFNRVITSTELAGLQYYNNAIVEFNRQNYFLSVQLLQKAAQLYPRSERIQAMQTTASKHAEKFKSSLVAKKAKSKLPVQEANTSGLSQK